MRKKPEGGGKKARSLGWLAELYFGEGAGAAKEAFASFAPETGIRAYQVLKAGQGLPSRRTDVRNEDGISYDGYSPPALWEAPYSLLRVRFAPAPQRDFIFHSGEEILIPIAGQIRYHFYWSPGGAPPSVDVLDPPLRTGSIIRINPQLPHHTWAVGRGGGEAWMVFRHLSEAATAISLESEYYSANAENPAPRRMRLKDLRDPGRYALVAWGLAEKIRLHREQANLRIAQLAAGCGVDPSHLSRIENADTNVSIETLVRIARFLRIGLEDLIAPQAWCREVVTFPRGGNAGVARPLLSRTPGAPHHLHPCFWAIQSGAVAAVPDAAGAGSEGMSSWIVLSGRVIFEMAGPLGSTGELVENGCVIHVRGGTPVRIQALQDSEMIQVICSHSTLCACRP
jgi:DNA-binding XRE family transcriptional regulator